MSWAGRLALVALTAAAFTPWGVSARALSQAPKLTHLRVSGGEKVWHPADDFRLDWDRLSDDPPVSAVHYLVRDAAGNVTSEASIPEDVEEIERVRVLSGPGIYRAEVWLEGPDGSYGPSATAALRFDDVPPGPASPIAPGWIAAGAPAVLHIKHPPPPLPLSKISGYAISVDRGSKSEPCADPARCTPAETDLSGGIGRDTISLYGLPEGVSFARVVAVSGSGMHSTKVESAILRVDGTRPEVELRGAPSGWSNRPVRLIAVASDSLSGMAAEGAAGPYTAIAIDGHTPATAPGGSVSGVVSGEGTHTVAFYARDAAGNVADGEAGAPAPSQSIVRIDETAPQVAFSRAQDPAELERIEATVSDALSGPDPSRGTIAVRPAGSNQSFTQLPTTVLAGRLLAHWDSDAYPRGAYEFRVTGYDAAGNSSSSERRGGGAPMVLSNPLKEATSIESGFGGERLIRRRTVRYGHGTAFSGRLYSGGPSALGGLPIAVTETFPAGADSSQRTTLVQTRHDGSFFVHLPPGPSRRIEASFAGNRLLSRSTGPRARFDVRSSIRLRVSKATAEVGGAPILFSGQVACQDTAIPTGGLPIQLQFRLPGSEWNEFRTVQTNSRGRFRYEYAFSDDDSRGTRFQFRAYLANQPNWPYEPAGSGSVTVTGR